MINKKSQSSTNVIILIFIVLGVSLLLLAFKSFSGDLITSEHANLNAQSIEYVANDLYGMDIDTSKYNDIDTTQEPFLLSNESQSSKDFSLEFQFAKEKGGDFWSVVFDIYNLPSYMFKLFGINDIMPDWLIYLIDGFLWVLVTVSIIYFVRNR